MSDRFVRQIDPRPNDEVVTPKRMSDYADTPNIVLVGDPGAGKSYLFGELAQAAKTNVQSARAFLNTPPGPAGAMLFIDALDERRAGRSDQATIDFIVQKLFAVNAGLGEVWMKCREICSAQPVMLTAGKPHACGGHVVLAIEPLTEAEQRDILKKSGVTEPQQFIKEAERRGLLEFLVNPQNLIMALATRRPQGVIHHSCYRRCKSALFWRQIGEGPPGRYAMRRRSGLIPVRAFR